MCTVNVDLTEWRVTVNETQLNLINVTDLHHGSECEMFVVAVNDVGTVASDHIHVHVGIPYAQFGMFFRFD